MQRSAVQEQATATAPVPLVVDLDGTLVRSDLLVESAFAHLGGRPQGLARVLAASTGGRAALKHHLAAQVTLDPAALPYDPRVITLIETARAAGRPVHLASAASARQVEAVARHLGLFDGWLASDATGNLRGPAKAARLVDQFGRGGFDYVGNDAADLAVWAVARRRVAVEPAAGVRRRLLALDPQAQILPAAPGRLGHWLHALRAHQWAKNLLVFVALVTAQQFTLAALVEAVTAFLAFSAAASAIYLVNDLVDLGADRRHPVKRRRPLAAGTLPIRSAIAAVPLLLLCAALCAVPLGLWFCAALAAYVGLAVAYTVLLKRVLMLDAVALALLYTLRVIGGAAAIQVVVSEWLLAFSLLIFTSLALTKRHAELAGLQDSGAADPANRDYRKGDLPMIAALAAAAGFNAVTVFTLYISSDTVRQLYAQPQVLWLACPVLIYWIARILVLVQRRVVDDDPLLFALRDRVSWIVAGAVGAILLAAQ
ncbi:UbiA family prenyltransferase [Zavarzinia sp. CC-PAN008]|uniref:UbiA family prenyltransferase n=1 Tax=Zavarzinia sp. CC-PAN008 TaxID=3243332 RepID=UPI003F74720B